jgi:hypothetical protein
MWRRNKFRRVIGDPHDFGRADDALIDHVAIFAGLGIKADGGAVTLPTTIEPSTPAFSAIWRLQSPAQERNGKLSSGPFSNKGICLTGIVQAKSNFRASLRPVALAQVGSPTGVPAVVE